MGWTLTLLFRRGTYHFYSRVIDQNKSYGHASFQQGGYIQPFLRGGKQIFWTITCSTKASYRVLLLWMNWFCSCINVPLRHTLIEWAPQTEHNGRMWGEIRLFLRIYQKGLKVHVILASTVVTSVCWQEHLEERKLIVWNCMHLLLISEQIFVLLFFNFTRKGVLFKDSSRLFVL